MSAEEESPEEWEGVEITNDTGLVDTFTNTARAASIVGDLRAALRKEGFTKEETFELVRMYWGSELGVEG